MTETEINVEEYTSIDKLTRDMKKASLTMGDREIRFLVDTYYQLQNERIRANNQNKALERQDEPNILLEWLTDQRLTMEQEVKKVLEYYSKYHSLGEWPRAVTGCGPVITSGLLAFIDMDRTKSAGQIWRLADMDPSIEWMGRAKAQKLVADKKKQFDIKGDEVSAEFITLICNETKRNPGSFLSRCQDKKGNFSAESLAKELAKPHFNNTFKTMCWNLGESFNKQVNRKTDVYGKLIAIRKAYEMANNDAGKYEKRAKEVINNMWPKVQEKDFYKTLKEGKLPQWMIHARSKRWATKIFLSHYFDVTYRLYNNEEPPLPYAMSHLGHKDFIKIPFFDTETWEVKKPTQKDVEEVLNSVGNFPEYKPHMHVVGD